MVCAVLVVLPGETVTALARWPRGLLVSALAPMSQVLGRAGSVASGNGGGASDSDVRVPVGDGPGLDYLRALEAENRQLRKLVTELGESYERLTRPGVRQVVAPVVSLAEGGVGLTVGVGERQGVRRGDVVVSGMHLVGRVTNVAPLMSDVDPVAREGVRLQVRVVPPTEVRPTRELFAWVDFDAKSGAFLAELSLDAAVEAGDVVHLEDERWPLLAQGRVVGVVAQLDDRTSKPLLLKRMVIRPAYSLDGLHRVIVLAEKSSGGGG